jgi:hypothetical protein
MNKKDLLAELALQGIHNPLAVGCHTAINRST